MNNYPIPSATKQVCLTETELMAMQFPTSQKLKPKVYKPIEGERMIQVRRLPEGYFITDHGRLLHQKTKKTGRIVTTEIRGSIREGNKVALITSGDRGKVAIKHARLMLEAFTPNAKSNYRQAVCLDGNPLNLLLENWKWMTIKNASLYRSQTGERKPKLKTKVIEGVNGKYIRRVVFSDGDLAEMERLLLAQISIHKIAEIFESQTGYVAMIKKKLLKRLNKENV
jgi:hypothetical protein